MCGVTSVTFVSLELDLEFEDFALVHRPVAVRHLVERTDAVEDAAGLDASLKHVGQQLLDVRAYGCGAAANACVLPECNAGRGAVVLGYADPADGPSGTCNLERGLDRLFEADAFEY